VGSRQPPYVTNAGKDAHVRVKKVGLPEVTEIRSWGAHERSALSGRAAVATRRAVLVLMVAASVLTGGCARHWTKPGGTYEQFARDSYDCAQQHTWEGEVRKNLYRACLQGRGYLFERGGEWIGVRD
jgi:hypothetical protein